MKKQPIKLLICLMLIGVLVSCKNETKDTNTTITDVVEEKIKESSNTPEAKQDGPFQVKSGVINYEERTLEGVVRGTYVFYFDDYGNKLRLEETLGGETSIYLYDQEKQEGVTKFPGRNASSIKMRQGEINVFVAKHSTSGYMKQPDEEIAGKNCTVYANNAKSAEGESQSVYWKYKGLLMKDVNRLGSGYILEAISIEEKALDPVFFMELKVE